MSAGALHASTLLAMAKQRAQRRALREADRQRRIEAARQRNESSQKRTSRRVASQPSLIANTKKSRARLALFLAILINALTWIISSDWSVRASGLVLSILVTPIVLVLFVSSRD